MQNDIKSLSVKKMKTANAENSERRIVFVASTATEDRDREIVEIATFRLPLKGGSSVLVSELPAGGSEDIDVPFITDHDLYDVSKTIGSVRRASFVDGQLIFEVGISSRAYAQEMLTLVEEGHLDNAFSIQYRDYIHDAERRADIGGEIVEVSLVTRGSNKDAKVLAVKSLKEGEAMSENDETQTVAEPVAETAEQVVAPAEEVAETAETVEVEASDGDDADVADTTPVAEPAEETAENNNIENKEKTMTIQNELAKEQVKAKSADQTAFASDARAYLKSKSAIRDYAMVSKSCGGDASLLEQTWKNHLNAKGITVADGESFLPTAVEQVLFKAWNDAVGALGTFRRTRSKSSRFYAMTTEDGALGHKKDDVKADQDITAIPRNAGLKVVYKKLPLPWIDIVNDESGELYRFREQELYDRVLHAIVRGAIVGDGLGAPSGSDPDYRVFDGTNGLYSIAGDISASATANSYASAVATQIAHVAEDNLYAKIVKTLGAVRTNLRGDKKVLVLPVGAETELRLLQNVNGGLMFPAGTDLATALGVDQIVELDQADFTRIGMDVIAYRTNAYTLGGPGASVRNWFDGNANLDYQLVEQPVYGSLEGYKAAAGYMSA